MSYYTINNYSITTPPGAIIAYTGSTSPSGWLICNGSEISRTTYSDLFAVISTTYGTGNGSTTFNIPDYRGAFLRGTGSQTKNYNSTDITYTGPSINNIGQSHATQVHSHGITDPGHSHEIPQENVSGNVAFFGTVQRNVKLDYGTRSESKFTGISINNSSSSGGNITNDVETRPFNFGINWIIKI